MFSDKQFGLPGGLVAAAKAIMEAKHDDKDKDDVDAKKMKGGKTKVDLNPETDDQSTDSDDMKKKSMKEGKEHTIPKTEKEKKLAALAHPKDKITHKDVLVGRGVVKEDELEEKITPSELRAQLKAKAAANKPKEDEVEEAAKKTSTPKAEMPKKKLDFAKINAVRVARKSAKSARHGDTSHLPPGWSTTFYREDIELDNDELVEIEEALKKADPAGKWISDFVHSDDPKFKGKSPEKRKQMALAAYYAKQRNEEVEEATKSATYNALMADPMKNRLERLKQKEKSMPQGISADRKKLAIEIDKIQKQLANKQRNEEVEEMEEAKLSPEDFMKGARRAGTGTTAELKASLEKKRKGPGSGKIRQLDKAELKRRNEEVEEMEEAKLSPEDFMKGARRAGTGTTAELKASLEKKRKGPGSGKIRQLDKAELKRRNEEVELSDEELERLEAIAQSLDEAKPTIVSAPIRGANQDQSGENTKSISTDYTISDSKKMKKEELELDEAKRGRPKKNPTPDDEQDEHEHVIMQLRKVVSTHGALPVKHLDGKSTKITPQLAQHALNKHSAMKTAAEKQDFESKMHKSHDSMKSALGQ